MLTKPLSSSSRLSALRNRHLGQRAVLVANGPSLNGMNLEFLRRETTIGLNKIFLGFSRFGFYPRYLVAINDKVIEQSASQLKALNTVKFISVRNAGLMPEDALTYHIDTRRPPRRFCEDITQGVNEGWTVTHAALQIAYFLGFQEVVLIGLDHRYEYTGEPNEARLLEGPDPNHFAPDYFSGKIWQNPDLANSEESYRAARSVFEQNGRRILDATVGGACTIFDKIGYREYFKIEK